MGKRWIHKSQDQENHRHQDGDDNRGHRCVTDDTYGQEQDNGQRQSHRQGKGGHHSQVSPGAGPSTPAQEHRPVVAYHRRQARQDLGRRCAHEPAGQEHGQGALEDVTHAGEDRRTDARRAVYVGATCAPTAVSPHVLALEQPHHQVSHGHCTQQIPHHRCQHVKQNNHLSLLKISSSHRRRGRILCPYQSVLGEATTDASTR